MLVLSATRAPRQGFFAVLGNEKVELTVNWLALDVSSESTILLLPPLEAYNPIVISTMAFAVLEQVKDLPGLASVVVMGGAGLPLPAWRHNEGATVPSCWVEAPFEPALTEGRLDVGKGLLRYVWTKDALRPLMDAARPYSG